MPLGYQIERLHHYGISFKDEDELEVAMEFYKFLGFTHVVKDEPRVKWFKFKDGSELHIFVDNHAPCPIEPNMVHGNFLVDNIETVWELWTKLYESDWSDPITSEIYRMSKEPYKDSKLDGVVYRVHAFDPWNNHLEFWEFE